MISISPYVAPGMKVQAPPPLFDRTESNIISIVCEKTGVPWEKIIGNRGDTTRVTARYMVCYFLFKYTILNKSQIAKKINKDHTTVIAALKKIPDYLDTEEPFRYLFNQIADKIENKNI